MIGAKMVRLSSSLVFSIGSVLSVLFLGSAIASAGELLLSKPYLPRPYTVTGLSINGSGYSSISGLFGGGFRVDSQRLIGNVEVGYNNARKVNDATIGNRKGHSRTAQARLFYRLREWILFRWWGTMEPTVDDKLCEAKLASKRRCRQGLFAQHILAAATDNLCHQRYRQNQRLTGPRD